MEVEENGSANNGLAEIFNDHQYAKRLQQSSLRLAQPFQDRINPNPLEQSTGCAGRQGSLNTPKTKTVPERGFSQPARLPVSDRYYERAFVKRRDLSEEELMLQAKYAKLKKKKKALQALKAPKQEPEKNLIPKRPTDARDAREVARKLLKSGAIQAIQKPQQKQETSFKRPKGQERKRSQQESSPGAQYQSFSSVETPSPNPATTAGVAAATAAASPDAPAVAPPAASSAASVPSVATALTPAPEKEPRVPNLYQQFANERDKEEQAKAGDSPRDRPRSGNTVYVSGNKVTEDFLKKHFSEFGEILNISMEIEKGRGFITFSKTESADRAIGELHSKSVGGIQLQVQLARRQPQINPINDAGSSAAWSALATNRSQKGKHKDNRELVCYDHDDMF